jgi:CRISPR-associated protein Csb1
MSTQEKAVTVTSDLLDKWATDSGSAVALHVRQKLVPIEVIESGDKGIVFPPTYADIGYNVDTFSDGTKVATIDSVGSQANRMEPLFKEDGPLADFVPQIKIKINVNTTVSIFDLPHRAADATVQSSPGLADLARDAFAALKQGIPAPLCALAPTSLVFGVWDSRGATGEKRPRLVRSLIRAKDVEVLHSAAQFNSVWKKLDESQQEDLRKEAEKKKIDLSTRGLADAPATFRKTKIQTYRDGLPNPEARVLGGVLVKGDIEREITVNLLALRGLASGNGNHKDAENLDVRRYLLGLTLLAASEEIDLFLREGCLLRYARNDKEMWYAIPRRGEPQWIDLPSAREIIKGYTEQALKPLKAKWPKKLEFEFSIAKAKELLAKKGEQEEAAAAG